MRRAKSKPYEGVLLQPIILPDQWSLDRKLRGSKGVSIYSAADKERDIAEIAGGEAERIDALLRHFDISDADEDKWHQLALALARQHVPGFKLVRAKGRPITASVDTLYALYRQARIKSHQLSRAVKVTDARICAALAADENFHMAVPALAGVKAKRLQNLLSEAKSLRRENIVCRWRVRRKQKRQDGVALDDDEGFWLWGDTPYWPSTPNPYLRRKLPRKG
jgi:hypothetical protein